MCLLSGGNIDSTILGRCIERGLAAESRLIKFRVTVSDRPGGVAELCKLMCGVGVSIKDIMHERAWVSSDIFSVQVLIIHWHTIFCNTIFCYLIFHRSK